MDNNIQIGPTPDDNIPFNKNDINPYCKTKEQKNKKRHYFKEHKTDNNNEIDTNYKNVFYYDKNELTTSNKKSQPTHQASVSRVAHLGLSIGSFLGGGYNIVKGIFPGMFAVGNAFLSNLSWKCIPFSNKTFFQAQKLLRGSATMLSRSYMHALKVLSPNAKFSSKNRNGLFTNAIIGQDQYITDIAVKDPYFFNYKIGSENPKLHVFQNNAIYNINQNHFIPRQIVSRINYLGLAILLTLTRTLDAVVGVIATPLSFAALLISGCGEHGASISTKLNNTAYRGLQALALINDLFYCTVKFIDPLAGTDFVPRKRLINEISYSQHFDPRKINENKQKINI